MALLDRLFGRTRSGDAPDQGFGGMVRIGGTYYNAKWNFTRVLNEVYSNPTGFRCINTIADDFCRPPWAIYHDDSPTTPVEDSTADELLAVLNRPDPMLSGTAMQRQVAVDRELNGRSFWLKLRGIDYWGDKGPLSGLKRLPCENVTVVTNFDRDLLGFIYTDDQGQRTPLLPSEVFYTHYAHPQNPWEGFPPAYIAGLPANVDDRAMRFNWRLLENDGALPGYITIDGLVPEDFQKFKAIWEAGNEPGKVRFLKGGAASFTKVGSSNKDMMQDLLRTQSQTDIALSFGMSPLVINPSEATFANGNVARINYMSTKIGSSWAMVADQFTTQIQADYAGYRIGFNLEGIEELGEAKDDLANRSISLYTAGLKSDDEARADMGMGPKSEAPGEFRAAPASPGELPVASEPESTFDTETKETAKTRSIKQAPVTVMKDWESVDRRVQAYETQAARKMKRFFDKQGRVIAATVRSRRGKSLTKALDGYFDRSRWDTELADEATDLFSDVIDSFGTWAMANLPTAKKFDATHQRVTDYIQGRSTDAAKLVNDTTEEQLRASIDALESQGLGVDDIAKGIEDYFADNAKTRSEAWARTECVGAANAASLEAAKQSDVVRGKSVLTAEGADEDCTNAEALGVLDLDDDSVDLPLHVACRCTWLYDVGESGDDEG